MASTWVSKDTSKPYYGKEVTTDSTGKIVEASKSSTTISTSKNTQGQTVYTTPRGTKTTNEAQAVNETLMAIKQEPQIAGTKPGTTAYTTSVDGSKPVTISGGVAAKLNTEPLYMAQGGGVTTEEKLAATVIPKGLVTEAKPHNIFQKAAGAIETAASPIIQSASSAIESGSEKPNKIFQTLFIDPNYKSNLEYASSKLPGGSGGLLGTTYKQAATKIIEKPTQTAMLVGAGYAGGIVLKSGATATQLISEYSPILGKAASATGTAANILLGASAGMGAVQEYKETGGIGKSVVTLGALGIGMGAGIKSDLGLVKVQSSEPTLISSKGKIRTLERGERLAFDQPESSSHLVGQSYELGGVPIIKSKAATKIDISYFGGGTAKLTPEGGSQIERVGDVFITQQSMFKGKPIGQPTISKGFFAARDIATPEGLTSTSYEFRRFRGQETVDFGVQKSITKEIDITPGGESISISKTATFGLGKKQIPVGVELEENPSASMNIIRDIASAEGKSAIVGKSISKTITQPSYETEYPTKPTTIKETVSVGGELYQTEITTAKPVAYTATLSKTASGSMLSEKQMGISEVRSLFKDVYPESRPSAVKVSTEGKSLSSSKELTSSSGSISKLVVSTKQVSITSPQLAILETIKPKIVTPKLTMFSPGTITESSFKPAQKTIYTQSLVLTRPEITKQTQPQSKNAVITSPQSSIIKTEFKQISGVKIGQTQQLRTGQELDLVQTTQQTTPLPEPGPTYKIIGTPQIIPITPKTPIISPTLPGGLPPSDIFRSHEKTKKEKKFYAFSLTSGAAGIYGKAPSKKLMGLANRPMPIKGTHLKMKHINLKGMKPGR